MKRSNKILSRAISTLLSILFTFSLTACAKKEPIVTNEEDKMKGELSVYYVDYADQTANYSDYTYELTRLLQKFQNEYSDVTVVPTAFGNRESMMTQVSTELSSGKGPDLFLLNFGSLLNFNKMSTNGVYENLSPYMKKDKTYNSEDYFEPVMKAGQINGKQYVLPLGFDCISLHTSEKKMANNGMRLSTDYTYNDILSLLNNSVDQAEKDDQIVPLALSLDRNDFLACFMEAFGMPVVDYKINSPSLDKASLLKVCDFLKNYYPYSASAFANKNENARQTQNARNVSFTINNNSYVGELITQSAIMSQINDKPVSFIMPKYDNSNQTTAQVRYYVSVNANSKNKQLAYDSAKAMMDLAVNDNIGYNFPISKINFDEWITRLESSDNKTQIDGNFIVGDFDVEKVRQVAENIQHVTLNDISVMTIVNDGMAPYIEGDTKTFDECYEETVNKLNLYINE